MMCLHCPPCCSVDGLHSSDLDWWVRNRPGGAIGTLGKSAYFYKNAYIEGNTDSFPGMMALATGGRMEGGGGRGKSAKSAGLNGAEGRGGPAEGWVRQCTKVWVQLLCMLKHNTT